VEKCLALKIPSSSTDLYWEQSVKQRIFIMAEMAKAAVLTAPGVFEFRNIRFRRSMTTK